MSTAWRYLFDRPSASRRMAILYTALAPPLLSVGMLLILLPIQESLLLGQALLESSDRWIWAAVAFHLVFGVGALLLAWGSWHEKEWALVLPLPRAAWFVILAWVGFAWAQLLLA